MKMIIRELSKNESLLENFDYFNDYNDTRKWLVYRKEWELMEKLDAGYLVWHKKYLKNRVHDESK